MRFALAVEYSRPRVLRLPVAAVAAAACRMRWSAPSAKSPDIAVTRDRRGRTDAGVHAVSQIVHFDTDASRPDSAWVRGVNTHLPRGTPVLWAHAGARRLPCALRRDGAPLHLPAARRARAARPAGRARGLVPSTARRRRDARRRSAPRWARTISRRSARPSARRNRRSRRCARGRSCATGPFVRFDFSANAFLHHMIRNIVGALVYVGAGRQPPDWIGGLLGRARSHARARRRSPPTASTSRALITTRAFGVCRPRVRAGRARSRRSHERHAHARQDLRHHPRRRRRSPRRRAGADAIGLDLLGRHAARASTVGRAREIADALPPFVTKVGVVRRSESAGRSARCSTRLPLDVAAVPRHRSARAVPRVRPPVPRRRST